MKRALCLAAPLGHILFKAAAALLTLFEYKLKSKRNFPAHKNKLERSLLQGTG